MKPRKSLQGGFVVGAPIRMPKLQQPKPDECRLCHAPVVPGKLCTRCGSSNESFPDAGVKND